jgi:regulator of nucleoside diphosphate kinase
MQTKEAVVNAFDQTRLQEVIELLRKANNNAPWAGGDKLLEKLAAAKALPPEEVPDDVITMNTIVRVRDVGTGKEEVYNLVFPWESKPLEGRVSVLSVLGLALYGARTGDRVEWETRNGRKQVEVVELVYQPEASKHYTL